LPQFALQLYGLARASPDLAITQKRQEYSRERQQARSGSLPCDRHPEHIIPSKVQELGDESKHKLDESVRNTFVSDVMFVEKLA